MGAESILLLGIVMMTCGSATLLLVRWTSPKLLGVGFLSAAFAACAVGAALLLCFRLPLLAILGADLAFLTSFVLLHIAVLRTARVPLVQIWHGGALLSVQAIVDCLLLEGYVTTHQRVISLGILFAVQSATTIRVLWGLAKGDVRAPALFSVGLLTAFGGLNLVRSGWESMPVHRAVLDRVLDLAGFSVFLVVALGVAFGFFWMTNAMLTADMEHMASTDPLTRLYNRRVFLKWCEKELWRTQRSSLPFSLLMVDLDHFKRVNDVFGHQVGDEVLCAPVEKMQDSVRGIDVLCRWGGEEFAVLLPNASADATRIVAERIRENIQKILVPPNPRPKEQDEMFALTASIGTATYRSAKDDVAGMLLRADQALYAAKHAGRNQVLVAV